MTNWFADTAGWANWLGRREPFHDLALALVVRARREKRRLVTTNYVLAELTTVLTSPFRMSRPRQIQLLSDLRAATWVDVVHVDEAIDAEAWALWESRLDKDWSLADCASFVVMRQHGLSEALTADHHFEQAGFRRLLV